MAETAALRALESGEYDALDSNTFTGIEPLISQVVGRDNVVYWGAFGPFEGGKSYILEPSTPEHVLISDGMLETRAVKCYTWPDNT